MERGSDGQLREARYLPAAPQPRARQKERQISDEVIIEVERASPERDEQELRLRRNLPSFAQVERLLDFYVATGEGRGAFVKAKRHVEKKRHMRLFHDLHSGVDSGDSDDSDSFHGGPRRRPPGRGPLDPRRRPYESSDNGSDDRYLPPGGNRPRKPSGGGPSAPSRVRDRSPKLRVSKTTPTEAAGHSGPSELPPERIIPREEPRIVTVVDPPYNLQDLAERSPIRPGRMAERHLEARRSMQPTVQEVSADDDSDLASLPSEEDDLRLQRSRRQKRRDEHTPKAGHEVERSQLEYRSRLVERRGGGGREYTLEESADANLRRYARLRGGAELKPPSQTSAIGADVLDDYDIDSKTIL